MFKKLGLMAAAGATALSFTMAAQAETTLRFAHLWPPVAGTHKNIFAKWAEKVEKDSGGQINVEIYPSSTLAKPPAQYEAVKNRIADATATILGYSAGRFPLTQLVELPGIAKDAAHGSCIVQNLYDEGHLDKEFGDTRPLFFWTHGAGLLHTKGKLVQEPADLSGMRVRRPTALVAKMLEGLKAQPVGMPAPASYQSMQRGVIDGVAFPWEGALSFRLNELSEYHTEIGGLYTIAFIATMNKDLYASMSADEKKAIDMNSGRGWADIAGKVFDDLDVVGRKQAVDAGHQIHVVEGGVENPAWKPVLDKAAAEYIAELEAKGLPGKKTHARVLELAASCAK